ncbi:MAG: DUF4830 domain-containing protein [Oscillospiraceae bacterium]|nr:DUF4830 domain-containing protein [Oscillospiraceae bacterium]
MNDTKLPLTKRKALTIVLAVAAVLCIAILLRSCTHKGPDLSTTEGRQSFLSGLGVEIDCSSEDIRRVQLPTTLDGAIKDYARLQEEQGYDLSTHLGEQCQQVTYRVTNHPDDSQTVLVTLYIQGKDLIAGDIHSTALNGFMQGLDMLQTVQEQSEGVSQDTAR